MSLPVVPLTLAILEKLSTVELLMCTLPALLLVTFTVAVRCSTPRGPSVAGATAGDGTRNACTVAQIERVGANATAQVLNGAEGE